MEIIDNRRWAYTVKRRARSKLNQFRYFSETCSVHAELHLPPETRFRVEICGDIEDEGSVVKFRYVTSKSFKGYKNWKEPFVSKQGRDGWRTLYKRETPC